MIYCTVDFLKDYGVYTKKKPPAITDEGNYKYVRLIGGEIVFCDTRNGIMHCEMVDREDRKRAVSAGCFTILPDRLKMQLEGSETLDLPTVMDDYEILERVLGKKFVKE